MKKESPVKKFPGHVILPEFLTLPQVRLFEDALDLDDLETKANGKVWMSVIAEKRLPVIFACVDEWHIEGVPENPELDTFPMTPIVPAGQLVDWLFSEINKVWIGEIESPKE